jgi:hypothetical protein
MRMSYTDDFTMATYTLNTRMLAFEDAEVICNDIGGHVVSHGAIAEQVAVENFYISRVSWTGRMPVGVDEVHVLHAQLLP